MGDYICRECGAIFSSNDANSRVSGTWYICGACHEVEDYNKPVDLCILDHTSRYDDDDGICLDEDDF